MPIDAEDEFLSTSIYRPTTLDIILEHFQSFFVNRKHPLSVVLLLLGLAPLDLAAALGAKGVTSAESLSTIRAGELQASLEVLDGYSALTEVYIEYCKS